MTVMQYSPRNSNGLVEKQLTETHMMIINGLTADYYIRKRGQYPWLYDNF